MLPESRVSYKSAMAEHLKQHAVIEFLTTTKANPWTFIIVINNCSYELLIKVHVHVTLIKLHTYRVGKTDIQNKSFSHELVSVTDNHWKRVYELIQCNITIHCHQLGILKEWVDHITKNLGFCKICWVLKMYVCVFIVFFLLGTIIWMDSRKGVEIRMQSLQ